MIFLRLFYEFFKTGLFAVGGGLATLPFLENMVVATGWFSTAQLSDMIAVSESTPGPIGVNMATYVGYNVAGVAGAVVATIGLITPSIIIILIISSFLRAFSNNKYVQSVFYGIRPASTGLIAASGISMVLIAFLDIELFNTTGYLLDLVSIKGIILAAVILVLTRYVKPTKKLHPIVFISASAVIGVIFKF